MKFKLVRTNGEAVTSGSRNKVESLRMLSDRMIEQAGYTVESVTAACLRIDEMDRVHDDAILALRRLVEANEEWNEAVAKVIGRQPGWTDSYLDEARAVLGRWNKLHEGER